MQWYGACDLIWPTASIFQDKNAFVSKNRKAEESNIIITKFKCINLFARALRFMQKASNVSVSQLAILLCTFDYRKHVNTITISGT